MPDHVSEARQMVPDPVTVLPVEQGDRDAAADMQHWRAHDKWTQAEDAMREGLLDDNHTVQAFARHRLAAEKAEMYRIVAWLKNDAPRISQYYEDMHGDYVHDLADAIEALAHRKDEA